MKSVFCLLVLLPAVFSLTYTPGTDTCKDRCIDHYDLYNLCQCTENCELFGDCCLDFYVHCVDPPVDEDSCEGLCGLFTSGKPCQCNDGCLDFGDCCDDYDQFCGGGGVDPDSSCKDRCGIGYDPALTCQCNDECESYSNCCDDYNEQCVGVDPDLTCVDRCGNGYDPGLPCQCNDQCDQFGNCCDDYQDECLLNDNYCKGRCDTDYDSALPCQCNLECPNYGNCCPDFDTECTASCDERCDDPFDSNQPCQCNTACTSKSDCCPDYNEICLNGTGPVPITEADITELAESLWTLDVNRLSPVNDYVINKQAQVGDGDDVDMSPDPFFTSVNESALSSRTYQAFIALMDNYISDTQAFEIYTLEELAEIEEFLDAIFESDVMSTTTQFFIDKGWYENEAEYREWAKEVWFGNYSRKQSDQNFGSSGFEHVFLGETRSSGVTGFHNWLQFYFQEKAGDLEYYGYVRENEPNQKGLAFVWKNVKKDFGSMIIGSSPEFEFAMFSVCFRVKGGAQCPFTLDGSPTRIQTYNIREIYIGSAYFIV
ncbi:poly(U)-specific endoribonuclease isoform X1 [Strongylocentrotus purpuratus]|uniref:Uridylate-specific endoribonuclease n=1 Tax=Strongylocentrotus purpuratus TaxID=7668 RepID=A0A7M7HLE8_STRPU|nr:poly(U)-specific endoribonuclease isoform X1 [Strongylocentrotus purpuratus]